MLDAVQPHGTKPPLFMVHGVSGHMPLGPALAEALGPDRPLYAIHSDGLDGAEAPNSIRQMVDAYVGQIRGASPQGPYVVGGMCTGGLVALEIARELARCGARVGAVQLLDPLLMPAHWMSLIDAEADDPKVSRQLERFLAQFLREIARQAPNFPFDLDDRREFHAAVKLALAQMMAAHRHAPVRYSGPAELVICEQRAAGYFHPASPWRQVLERPAKVHVLPGNHYDIFGRHRATVGQLVRLAVEAAFEE